MSLLVQRSVVESLMFNGKNIRAVHVKGEEFLVSRDVYKTIGCHEETGKISCIKGIQKLVPTSTSYFLET